MYSGLVVVWRGSASWPFHHPESDTTCAVRLNGLDRSISVYSAIGRRSSTVALALVNVNPKCQRYVLFFKVAALQNYATITLANVIPKSQSSEVAMWAVTLECNTNHFGTSWIRLESNRNPWSLRQFTVSGMSSSVLSYSSLSRCNTSSYSPTMKPPPLAD